MASKSNKHRTNEQFVQDSVAENYEQLRYKLPYAKAYHIWWLNEMVGLASLPNESHPPVILDNGCGTGFLLERLGESKLTFGLDLSFGMLTRAYKINHRIVQGDSCNLPFADNQFDLIFSRALIHHLPDPNAGLREMKRVLKPHGQIILADTNYSLLSSLPRHIAYQRENFSEGHANLRHQEYLAWIRSFFSIEQVRFFGYLAYPFGFPDMMGKFRNIAYPIRLIRLLIQIDRLISRFPILQRQSWGIMVSARKKSSINRPNSNH
jgi:SAM-dependent methyltransferase